MWINGPFKPYKNNDLEIFWRALRNYLNEGEKVCADRIYNEKNCVKKGDMHEQERTVFKNILCRHEVINSWLKSFNVLYMPFTHHVSKHIICLFAVANLTQLFVQTDNLFDAFQST